MGSFYVVLYRMYFRLKKSAAEGVLRRWPSTGRGLDWLKRLVQRHFLRKAHAWVRIQSGLSQELWMQICVFGASGVESMNPKCRMQFWLRFGPVLLSMTWALTWEPWLLAPPSL